ncbi:MAG: AMMECR1 domain-containing protein [Verrucomicrobia bacterium]|nr:AMMECR1 domain-containing protein [Verrucomicrobiota bacterium]
MPHAPILVPGVGGESLFQARATATAMSTVAEHALAAQPDTVVLVSPHSPRQRGAFGLWSTPRLRGSLGRFGSPEDCVDLPLDRDFVDRLELAAERHGLRMWRITRGSLDHGALVPLYYLTAAGWNGGTVVLGLNFPGEGGLEELGRAIAATTKQLKRRTAIIASGDMSHRLTRTAPSGYDPEAHRFDEAFIGLLRDAAVRNLGQIDPALQEQAAEDVVDSTAVAVAAIDFRTAGHEVLSYEGPFGVGYGVAILFEPEKSGPAGAAGAAVEGKIVSCLSELPAVARYAVAARLQGGEEKPPFCAQGELTERHAVFVTVRTDDGKLRGCRGVTTPGAENVMWETWYSAVAAAFFDTRFPSVAAGELPRLRFTVTVLGQLEPVASPGDLDPAGYGVVVNAGDGRTGALLPAIAGIDSVAEQLAVARHKAGIADDESVTIARFKARSFTELPAETKGGRG